MAQDRVTLEVTEGGKCLEEINDSGQGDPPRKGETAHKVMTYAAGVANHMVKRQCDLTVGGRHVHFFILYV